MFQKNELFKKKTSYILEGNLQSLKNKKKFALKKLIVSYDAGAISTAVKHRKIHCKAKIKHTDITL